MSDELTLEDIQPPPNPRYYSNVDDLHGVLLGVHSWAINHMKLFSELIPENQEKAVHLRAVPTKVFLHNQSLVVLSNYLATTRRIREWYDYLVREHEHDWTGRNALQYRLMLLQQTIQLLNQTGETLEQRELREENNRPAGIVVMAPGGMTMPGGNDASIPPPPSFR
jgi:hypothetical protein